MSNKFIDNNKELIEKAREAGSAEELLALAKENGIKINEEQAKDCYDRLHITGELADDELDSVSGGGGCGGGKTCPICKSRDIELLLDRVANRITRVEREVRYTCHNCTCTWWEYYPVK